MLKFKINLAESSKVGYGSKRAVLSLMRMMKIMAVYNTTKIITRNNNNNDYNKNKTKVIIIKVIIILSRNQKFYACFICFYGLYNAKGFSNFKGNHWTR
jgi:hypothetical protein